MVKAEAPLDNPDWSDEENRRFDTLASGTGLPTAKIRRDLGLEEKKPSKRIVKPVYGATQREIADNDASAAAFREQTVGGGEVLDMPDEIRKANLEEVEKAKRIIFGGGKTA